MKPHKISAGGAHGAALQVKLSCSHLWDTQGHCPCWYFPSTSSSSSSLLSLGITVGFHPQPRGVLVFNACVFIFAIAQTVPDPTLSPALFDPHVSGVQSGTFHSLPPLHSFPAARLLKPGAICQPQRVLINTGGPGPVTLQPTPKRAEGRAQRWPCFHYRVCWRGRESFSFLLSFCLSFHGRGPAGTLLAACPLLCLI